MTPEESKLSEAISLVFEANSKPALFDSAARDLLAAVRRGDSDMALRQQAANVQLRLIGSVNDAQCSRIVALAHEVTNASRT